jgi:hypothetical protein
MVYLSLPTLLATVLTGLVVARKSSAALMSDKPDTSVAFLGNSILYFNDCPRLIEQMLLADGRLVVVQNSCLRGGASLSCLWRNGNAMDVKFASPQALRGDGTYDIGAATPLALLEERTWNYVVMNDQTQHPAREDTRNQSIAALQENYLPMMKGSILVFLQTTAYQFPQISGTEDLGDFDEFTDRVAAGYRDYVDICESVLADCRLAPVGEAFRYLYHNNSTLFEKLYSWDSVHPSPHGTWLEASVIFCTMTNTTPPTYNPDWWNKSRVMQPVDQNPLPRPTAEEAEDLRKVAILICNLDDSNDTVTAPSPFVISSSRSNTSVGLAVGLSVAGLVAAVLVVVVSFRRLKSSNIAFKCVANHDLELEVTRLQETRID